MWKCELGAFGFLVEVTVSSTQIDLESPLRATEQLLLMLQELPGPRWAVPG